MPGSRRSLVRLIAGVLLGMLALGTAGCFDRGDEARVFVNGTEVAPLAATAAPPAAGTVPALAFTPTPFESDLDPENLTGFTMPIADACLPSRDEVMPNAPRSYRNGVHEGVDFYNGDVCTPIEKGTQVLAMHHGVVTRAELDYVDITPEEVEELADRTAAQGFSDPETLDIYRGRQIWIDHGSGVVTRYAHLSAIAEGIGVGVEVRAGQVIGAVGESGTPESITAPGTEVHLHAEVRIDGRFLGEDLPAAEVRRLYERLFGPPADAGPPEAAVPAETPGTGDDVNDEATPIAPDADASATAEDGAGEATPPADDEATPDEEPTQAAG